MCSLNDKLLTVGYISHMENTMPIMYRKACGQTNIKGIVGQHMPRNPQVILRYHRVIYAMPRHSIFNTYHCKQISIQQCTYYNENL